MKIAGIFLIVIGIAALIHQDFSYTQTKQVAKIGSVEIRHEESMDVPISPLVSGAFIALGVTVLIFSGRGKS